MRGGTCSRTIRATDEKPRRPPTTMLQGPRHPGQAAGWGGCWDGRALTGTLPRRRGRPPGGHSVLVPSPKFPLDEPGSKIGGGR